MKRIRRLLWYQPQPRLPDRPGTATPLHTCAMDVEFTADLLGDMQLSLLPDGTGLKASSHGHQARAVRFQARILNPRMAV